MEQTLAEFKVAQKTKTPKSPNKVTNSWGVYDYYKYYRVHRPNLHEYVLNESTYFAIIRRVNKLLVEELCTSGEIEFPHRMGGLKTYKTAPKTFIKNGQVKTTKPVNWNETLNLWYKDEEAKKKKTLIYYEDKENSLVRYKKSIAKFKNKGYYRFSLCRDARKKVFDSFKNKRLTLVNIYHKEDMAKIKGLYDE